MLKINKKIYGCFHLKLYQSRSKTACRATPATAAGGGKREQGLAQRSKNVRAPSGNIFRAPQEGLLSNFKSFCPCQKASPQKWLV